MPFQFDQEKVCTACHAAGTGCIEDCRVNRIKGRDTKFRITQHRVIDCAFEEFIPGTESDPEPGREFRTYGKQAAANVENAGRIIFGDEFDLTKQQVAKVGGDVFEIFEAAAIWSAAAAWNRFMDTGTWPSQTFRCPEGSIAAPARKVAVVKLPRGYDTTKLFREDVRAVVGASEHALRKRDMELGLSSPDIVGVRIPDPMPDGFEVFLEPLPNLKTENRELLESAYKRIEGTLEGRSLLFAIAVKTSTRSDRLYQPLFEANVLKFLIGYVLHGASFRFHVHMETFEGANVRQRYKAAALISLLLGGDPRKAVDHLYQALKPNDTAQLILDELPLFPL